MSLPVLLNAALGLILIYLVLSLIASEIQEIITILLEWRANHLKEAIVHLLMQASSDGQTASPTLEGVQEESVNHDSLVDRLYKNPLIVALNGVSYLGEDHSGSYELASFTHRIEVVCHVLRSLIPHIYETLILVCLILCSFSLGCRRLSRAI